MQTKELPVSGRPRSQLENEREDPRYLPPGACKAWNLGVHLSYRVTATYTLPAGSRVGGMHNRPE